MHLLQSAKSNKRGNELSQKVWPSHTHLVRRTHTRTHSHTNLHTLRGNKGNHLKVKAKAIHVNFFNFSPFTISVLFFFFTFCISFYHHIYLTYFALTECVCMCVARP